MAGSGRTTLEAIPFPVDGDAFDVSGDLQALAEWLDARMPPIGAQMAWAGQALPAGTLWDLADGHLIDRGVGLIGEKFFAAVGHAYNGGIDPGAGKVRLPDKRNRVSIGADDMGTPVYGTAVGAGGRLPNTPTRNRGQNGGEERHLLTGPESGVKVHGHTATQAAHHHAFNGATVLTTSGAWANYGTGGSVSGTQTQTDDQTPAITVASATAQSADVAHNVMQPFEVDVVIVRIA